MPTDKDQPYIKRHVTFNETPKIFEISHSTTDELIANCDDLLESESKAHEYLSVNSSTDSALPYITAYIDDSEVHCLIDTGSSANILNKNCLSLFIEPLAVNQTSVKLCGINKSPLNVHGECTINLIIGNKTCPVECIIADISADIILGNPFIKQYSALVNLKDSVLTIPQTPVITVPINNVQVSHQIGKDIHETASHCKLHCAINSTIRPYQAFWMHVYLDSEYQPENLLIFPEISSHDYGLGQFVSLHDTSNTYPVFIVNNTCTEWNISHGDIVGTTDPSLSEQYPHIDINIAHGPDHNMSVNTTYNIKLSESDRELRWTNLCTILKTDSWKISDSQKQVALEKFRQYEFVFALENEPLGMMQGYEHEINVGEAKPINLRPRPLDEKKQKALDEIIDDLLKRGIIRPSRSPWAAPLCLVKRPSDQSWRMCCDYRKLNNCTIKDAFPLPNINHVLGTMKHSKYFSTVDLASGFHQLRIKESDIPITAFCTPDNLYEFVCLPFGLCNGPPSFVRAISSVLKLNKSQAIIYFDDILVLGMTFLLHLNNILAVLDMLMKANLKLKAKKCCFFALQIEFLGHVITEKGITCSPSKIECIKNIPIPTTPKSLRSYIGFFSYYRKFCPKYSEIAKPLFQLAVADKKDFKWTDEANTAFLQLKSMLSNPPILTLPSDSDSFILVTDASGFGIGAALTVDRPEGRKIIAYASHLLEKSRRAYDTTKREMYSVVFYVQYFKMYLLPKPFIVETDHRCLQFLANFKDPPAIIARWIAILSDYNYTIVHKPATNGIMKVADALSRPSESEQLLPVALSPEDNLLDSITDNTNKIGSVLEKEIRTDIVQNADICNLYTISTIQPLTVNLIDDGAGEGESKIESSNSTNENSISGQDSDLITLDIDKTRQQSVLENYTSQISTAQNNDMHIKQLKLIFSTNYDAKLTNISSEPPLVKFYWSQKQRLKLQDDILYYAPKSKTKVENFRIIVPFSKIKELLKLAHDDQMAGHRSPGKMLPLLKQHYHWFNMKAHIELYVKRCQSCGAHKKPRATRPRAPLFATKVSSKFERLSIDFAGPFNKTKRGNRFILLGVCCFTKFAFSIAMPTTDSENVARVLIERWIVYFGVPLEIHSDSGSNLISELIKHLYRLLNIKQSNSLAYVPQQNGAAEKLVSTIKNMVCHFAVNKPRLWDDVVPLVVLAYNNQIHASTKVTPQQMVMGESARVSLDLAWGAPPIVEDLEEAEYVSWLREVLYDIHDYALTHLNVSIQTMKDRFDKGQFGKPYVKEDLVWKLKGKFESGSRKFQRRYDGIYIILEKMSNTAYLIKHLKTHKEETVHFNRLKRAYLNPLTLDSLLQQMNTKSDIPSRPEPIESEEPIIIGYRTENAPVINPLPLNNEQLIHEPIPDLIRHDSPPLPPRRHEVRRRVPKLPVRTYNFRTRSK